VGTLQLDITRQSKEIADLRRDNVNLQKQITDHSKKLEELVSYSKCDNLIIRGLPDTSSSKRASGSPLSANAILHPLESLRSVKSAVMAFCHDILNVTVPHSIFRPLIVSEVEIKTSRDQSLFVLQIDVCVMKFIAQRQNLKASRPGTINSNIYLARYQNCSSKRVRCCVRRSSSRHGLRRDRYLCALHQI